MQADGRARVVELIRRLQTAGDEALRGEGDVSAMFFASVLKSLRQVLDGQLQVGDIAKTSNTHVYI